MPVTLPTGPIDDDIYKGFWINHSLGRFRGATLTLERQPGGLIIAFLALFIATTAQSLWKITRFLIHVSGSTPSKKDGVYHQRQAILRNQPIALSAVLDFCRLSYVWKDRAYRSLRRILPVTILASVISIFSVTAGLLSSRILTSSNNEVLITGQGCGAYGSDPDLPLSTYEPIRLFQSQSAADDFAYATQCYTNDTTRNELCGTFTIPTLPFTSERNATCPFSTAICKSETGNILLDSGVLHSRSHLGLNHGPDFTLRYKTHCAPLRTTGFTEIRNITNGTEDRLVYLYGESSEMNDAGFSFNTKGKKPFSDGKFGGDYKFYVVFADDPEALVPELHVPNGAVTLVFLDASEIVYVNKTDDPWFSASTPFDDNILGFGTQTNLTNFVPDEPAGVLGCVTQRSYCNPNITKEDGCVHAWAKRNRSKMFERAWPDVKDQSAMRAFVAALSIASIGSPDGYVDIKGGLMEMFYKQPNLPTLLSRNTLLENIQTAIIPKDRWQEEREHLYKAGLAAIQSTMIKHARGLSFGKNDFCKNGKHCSRICHSQKIRSSKHYSFSAWILGIILVAGSVLILVSIFIEDVFAILLRYPRFRSAKLIHSHAEWQAGSTLQLQRMVNESLGLGTWTRTGEAIPITEAGDTLGVLDIANPKHARMVVPTDELDVIDSTESHIGIATRTSGYSKVDTRADT